MSLADGMAWEKDYPHDKGDPAVMAYAKDLEALREQVSALSREDVPVATEYLRRLNASRPLATTEVKQECRCVQDFMGRWDRSKCFSCYPPVMSGRCVR